MKKIFLCLSVFLFMGPMYGQRDSKEIQENPEEYIRSRMQKEGKGDSDSSGKMKSSQDLKTYAIGSTGPAGGIVFYDKGSSDGGWRYMEVSPVDLSGDAAWNNGKNINVPTKKYLRAGKANTEAIIAAQGSGTYAAKLCADYEYGGYKDWFLPSLEEIEYMYKNLKSHKSISWTGISYWTSTQYDGRKIAVKSAYKVFEFKRKTDKILMRGAGSKDSKLFVKACRYF